MLEYIAKSRKLAKEILVKLSYPTPANIALSIQLLEDLRSQESGAKKYTLNETSSEIIKSEFDRTSSYLSRIIELLREGDAPMAQQFLSHLVAEPSDFSTIVSVNRQVLQAIRKEAQKILPLLQPYVIRGGIAIELFNADKPDILYALSELVGKDGMVYGIDEDNPFLHAIQMQVITRRPNVHLIKATVPSIPAPKAHTIVIRGFLSSYTRGK